MNRMLQVQNPHTGRWEPLYVTGLPDPPEPPKPTLVQVQQPRSSNAHPLLIIGIVIGALFGLIACLPPKIRGWVVLAMLGGIVWFCWTANRDQKNAQVYTGTTEPVPAEHHPYIAPPFRHYSDYAPRAELVRLPNK